MLPIPTLQRELRAAASRRATHRLRVAAAAAGIAVLCWKMASAWLNLLPLDGRELFDYLSLLALVFCLGAGVVFTADCLAEEKREGTLGLLFLAGLSPWEIVLGKLGARGLGAVFFLVALTPILAVPLVVGGMTLSGIAVVVAFLLNIAFMSLAAGLLASALCWRADTAQVAAVLIALVAIAAAVGLQSPAASGFLLANGEIAAWIHLFGWGYLGMAGVALKSKWRQSAPLRAQAPRFDGRLAALRAAGNAPKPAPLRMRAAPRRSSGRTAGRSLADVDPIVWLCFRSGASALTHPVWLGLLLCAVPVLAVVSPLPNGLALTCGLIGVQGLFKLGFSSETTRLFAEGRREGTLELLTATPFGAQGVLAGQWRALLLGSRVSVAILVLGNLTLIGVGYATEFIGPGWTFAAAVQAPLLFLDLYALAWTGVWQGWRTAHQARAVLHTLARVVVLPIVLFGAVIALVGSVALFRFEAEMSMVWLTISALNNLYWWTLSRRQLLIKWRHPGGRQEVAGKERWSEIPASPRRLYCAWNKAADSA